MKICIDPGHGTGNKKTGIYDPGAVSNGYEEANIAMDWANGLRAALLARGHRVIRTRVDAVDPCPIGQRAKIAKAYQCDVMISMHCNAANGQTSGTETFHRGQPALARKINDAVVKALSTKDRGIKTEGQSQHATLAVMAFQPCVLLEIGFLDHAGDRAKMLDAGLRKLACERLAEALTEI